MAHEGLIAEQRTVERDGKSFESTYYVKPEGADKSDAEKVPKDPPGTQLRPEHLEQLKLLGCSKLPPSDIPASKVVVNLTGDNDRHALVSWRDGQGHPQSGYSAEFHRRNAEEKWERVKQLEPKMPRIERELHNAAAKGSDAHAAALVILRTGLRIGGDESLARGHYGVSTMLAQHVKVSGDEARISYIGKGGKENVSTVRDPRTVALLRDRVAGKAPSAPVFKAGAEAVRKALPDGVHPKDFRTVVATRIARETLAATKPPPPMSGNEKQDMRAILKALNVASTRASEALNNTPAMARSAYIHPNVFADWATRSGVPQEWIK